MKTVSRLELISIAVISYPMEMVFWNLNYQLTSSSFFEKVRVLFVEEVSKVAVFGSYAMAKISSLSFFSLY